MPNFPSGLIFSDFAAVTLCPYLILSMNYTYKFWHVARMGEGRGVHRVLGEGDHWGDPDVDGRIT